MTEIINKIDTLIVIYSDDNPLYKEVNKSLDSISTILKYTHSLIGKTVVDIQLSTNDFNVDSILCENDFGRLNIEEGYKEIFNIKSKPKILSDPKSFLKEQYVEFEYNYILNYIKHYFTEIISSNVNTLPYFGNFNFDFNYSKVNNEYKVDFFLKSVDSLNKYNKNVLDKEMFLALCHALEITPFNIIINKYFKEDNSVKIVNNTIKYKNDTENMDNNKK